MNSIQAQMTLVAVSAKIDCNSYYLENKVLHGLVHHSLIADREALKKYCIQLVDQYINSKLIHAVDADALITWEFVEYGVVVPDMVSLPETKCNPQKAGMVNMLMVVEPLTPITESEKQDHPDIVEVLA